MTLVCYKFNLPKQREQAQILDTIFLFKILSSYYSVLDVLSQVNFNIPVFSL